MIKRINKFCKYYPCHKGLEDCTFCYCPFYPCLDEKKGHFIYSAKSGKKIWSCETCSWIHKKKVVDRILASIRKDKRRKYDLKNNKAGIIILSHGSRLRQASVSLEKTVKSVRRKTGIDAIVPAYLQLWKPDLERSVKYLVSKGHKTIIIIPYFLFNGNHVTRDIPGEIAKEKKRYPEINFIYTKNLGDDKRISDIVADMIEEAVGCGNTR